MGILGFGWGLVPAVMYGGLTGCVQGELEGGAHRSPNFAALTGAVKAVAKSRLHLV